MRIENYDVEIVRYAKAIKGEPLVWGDTDCANIVRNGIYILLGRDPFKGSLKRWTGLKSAKNRADAVPVLDRLFNSGAIEVERLFSSIGDVALGPATDPEGLPQLSLILTRRKVLISTQEYGVQIVPLETLSDGTRFFRYE